MKAMVTGAGGFVGRHLVRRLRDGGLVVTPVVSQRRPPRAGEVAVDVCDVAGVRRAVDEAAPDVVFHLAGTATREASGFDVNRRGTTAVLDAVTRAGAPVRVVVASTDALTDRAPADPYEQSKAAAEAAAACARDEHAVDVVIARLANVYGPGDQARDRLVPAAAAAAVAGASFEPVAPASVLDLVHVDDVTSALVRLGQPDVAPLHRVASGVHVTVAAVAQCVAAIARGEAPPSIDVSPYESSVALVPGWTPKIALVPGLERTVRWYLERSDDEGAG